MLNLKIEPHYIFAVFLERIITMERQLTLQLLHECLAAHLVGPQLLLLQTWLTFLLVRTRDNCIIIPTTIPNRQQYWKCDKSYEAVSCL